MEETPTPRGNGISGAEPAQILGLASEFSVYRLVSQGVLPKARKYAKRGLDQADVERVALDRWKPGHSYFATTTEAAELLGVTRNRVQQLVDRGFLPAIRHDGRWFFRRHQVEVVVNAREARRLRGTLGTGT
jgi:excisionase family DNA binding protein